MIGQGRWKRKVERWRDEGRSNGNEGKKEGRKERNASFYSPL